jgi:hypothetical protein
MKDKFLEFGCEFLNEAFCEEELESEGLTLHDVELAHFEEHEVE